jgi:hypothetical protein
VGFSKDEHGLSECLLMAQSGRSYLLSSCRLLTCTLWLAWIFFMRSMSVGLMRELRVPSGPRGG